MPVIEIRDDNVGNRTFFTRKTRHQRQQATARVVRQAKKIATRHSRRTAKQALRRADY